MSYLKVDIPKTKYGVHSVPVVVQRARVMTPTEYRWVERYLPSEYHKLLFKTALVTGMRHVELEKFLEADLSWYQPDRRCIVVPEEAVLKVKVGVRRRVIPLSDFGMSVITKLQEVREKNAARKIELFMPHRSSWGKTLFLAATKSGIPQPETILPKCTRKTWESWLLCTYPQYSMQIVIAMGHTSNVAIRHYIGLGWSLLEREDMRPYTFGFVQDLVPMEFVPPPVMPKRMDHKVVV